MQLSSVSGKRERTVNCVTVTSCSTEWLLHNYLPLTPFSMSISPRNPRQRSFNNYHESHCLNQDWLWKCGFGVCNVRLWRRYIPSLMISQSSCIGKGYGQSEDHPKPYLIFIIMYNAHLNTSQLSRHSIGLELLFHYFISPASFPVCCVFSWHVLSMSLIPLCLNSWINESAWANCLWLPEQSWE